MSYIGTNEIVNIENTIVTFSNWTKEEYTDTQLSYLVTDEPKWPTQYRDLILEQVVPEITEIIDNWTDELEIAKDVMWALEKHNLTNSELQSIMPKILNNRIWKHNEYLEKTVWTEVEKFKADTTKIKEVDKILIDSYTKMLFIATWKLIGTYQEWIAPEDCVENIRFSHLVKAVTNTL